LYLYLWRMAPNGSQLTLDKEMTRLVQLCSQPSHERDVDSVLKIVNNNAPNLLNGLASELKGKWGGMAGA